MMYEIFPSINFSRKSILKNKKETCEAPISRVCGAGCRGLAPCRVEGGAIAGD